MSHRSSTESAASKPGIPDPRIPWLTHQKMSPAVCSAVWGAVRSAGRRGKPAPPGPSPMPDTPWQTAQCCPYSSSPRPMDRVV